MRIASLYTSDREYMSMDIVLSGGLGPTQLAFIMTVLSWAMV